MKYIVEHFCTVVLKMLINVSIQLTFKWNIHTKLPYDITVNGRWKNIENALEQGEPTVVAVWIGAHYRVKPVDLSITTSTSRKAAH